MYQCELCGLVSLQPQPDQRTLAEAFPDWFWKSEIQQSDAPQSRIHSTLELLQRWHPTPGTLLDVGCGNGSLILAAVRAGWTAQGIEISPEQAEYGREISIDDLIEHKIMGHGHRH